VKKYHLQGGITANNLAEAKEEKKKDDARYYAKGKVELLFRQYHVYFTSGSCLRGSSGV
jgi:hypothetical protein